MVYGSTKMDSTLVLNLFCSFLKYIENENIERVKIGWALKPNCIGPVTKGVDIVSIEVDCRSMNLSNGGRFSKREIPYQFLKREKHPNKTLNKDFVRWFQQNLYHGFTASTPPNDHMSISLNP